MKKQTAVDWLESEMLKPNLSMKEILEQAKEMEEEQIVQAFNLGQQEEAKQPFWTKGAKYYEETFNK